MAQGNKSSTDAVLAENGAIRGTNPENVLAPDVREFVNFLIDVAYADLELSDPVTTKEP